MQYKVTVKAPLEDHISWTIEADSEEQMQAEALRTFDDFTAEMDPPRTVLSPRIELTVRNGSNQLVYLQRL